MQIGFLGLGKMGKGLVLAMREKGIEVFTWNRSPNELATDTSIESLVAKLTPGKRVLWLMVLSGKPVDEVLAKLVPLLAPGDTVVDGGNTFYKDDAARASMLTAKGISYLEVGVSGGPKGARTGACLMVGGDRGKYEELLPLWKAIAAPDAFGYMGTAGAGHFAKMVHNGIEYGMMEAIAEGAAILEASDYKYDLASVFRVYNNRSVIESRLVEWTQEAFAEDPKLSVISSKIGRLGEGDWTVKAAEELGVADPVIQASVDVRIASLDEPENFRNKVVSAMRAKFGGHDVTTKDDVDSFEK